MSSCKFHSVLLSRVPAGERLTISRVSSSSNKLFESSLESGMKLKLREAIKTMGPSFVLMVFGVLCITSYKDIANAAKPNLDTLELLQILFRHGSRSPMNPFPNDAHKDFWTGGLSRVTNSGKEQQYQLGRYLRQRYDSFLNASYYADEIVVNSTDTDRTLTSAACLLAGLYAPSGDQVWNPDIAWQPIPIYSVPKVIDYFVSANPYCPKADDLTKEVENSKEMQELTAENEDLLELVSEKTGRNITDAPSINDIYDTLFCEQSHNLSWPSWVAPVWSRILEVQTSKDVIQVSPSLLRRLKGGPLLGHMIKNMHLAISGNAEQQKRKIFLYSSHDDMLLFFMSALDVLNNMIPPYSSAIIVELHHTTDGHHAVQIAYKNTTGSDDPYVFTIPGCTELCPLEELVKLTEPMIPTDVLQECGVTPSMIGNVLLSRIVPEKSEFPN